MKNFIKKHDLITKGFALMAAFVFWLFVMGTENPERDVEYPVTVELIGETQLLNAHNLSVISGKDITTKISVRANNDQFLTLESEDIVATADLSSITSAGKYTLSYEVALPSNNMSVVNKNPSYIDVFVDKIVTETIPLTYKVNGTPPLGYHYNNPILEFDEIQITGPRTEVQEITQGLVTINADNLTGNLSEQLSIELVDVEGEIVSSPNITKSESLANVFLDVKVIKNIPISVEFVESDTVTLDMLQSEIEPLTIKVIGENSFFDENSSVEIGSIQLSESLDGQEVAIPINLPSEISLAPDEPRSVNVKIELNLNVTETVLISDIELIDTAPEGTGKNVTTAQQFVSITVIGSEEAYTALGPEFDETIKLSAEFDSRLLNEGLTSIPITVVAPDSLTVSGTYTVNVNVEVVEE